MIRPRPGSLLAALGLSLAVSSLGACGGDDVVAPGGLSDAGPGGGSGAGGAGAGGATVSGGSGGLSGSSGVGGAGGASAGSAGAAGEGAGGAGAAGSAGAEAGGASAGGTSSGAGGDTCLPPNPCDGGDSTPMTPVCSPTATWGEGTAVAGLPASGEMALVSITPDERVIAWSDGTALRVASRATVGDAFGGALTVVLPAGYGGDGRGALSPDGLRLVLGRDDGLALGEVTRAAVDQAFGGVIDEAPFVEVNTQAQLTGWPVRGPLLTRADSRLYFLSYAPGAIGRMFVARRGGPKQNGSGNVAASAWGVGSALNTDEFSGAAPDKGFVPTGAPSDGATLFVLDEVAGTGRAIWSSHTGSNVDASIDLGPRRWSAPNAACTRLYYSAGGGSGGILVATATP